MGYAFSKDGRHFLVSSGSEWKEHWTWSQRQCRLFSLKSLPRSDAVYTLLLLNLEIFDGGHFEMVSSCCRFHFLILPFKG